MKLKQLYCSSLKKKPKNIFFAIPFFLPTISLIYNLERFFMKRGEIIENITVEKLVFGGKGFVRLEDGKVAFITGWAIPGSCVNLKIIKKKKDFYEAQITEVLEKSAIETESYDLFPGAPWMNINYSEQLKIKQTQIEESFFRIKNIQPDINFLPIVPAPDQFGYRNKIEFSFGKYISHRDDIRQDFNVGFHKRGEFSKVEDYDECLLIDERQNEIYRELKAFCKKSWLPVYDQKMNHGFWRHFMMRRMHFSTDILIVLSVYPGFFESPENTGFENEETFTLIREFLKNLVKKYSDIKSVYISHNANKSDTLIGDMELVSWDEVITETLLGLTFDIWPKSFFQTNSSAAEVLYSLVKDFAATSLSSKERDWGWGNDWKIGTILDLYAGTGTIGMILAESASDVVSVELVQEASKSWEKNAVKNKIHNISFVNAKVEEFLDDYLKENKKADLLIIDPPRAGMHPSALPNILKFGTQQMIYVSCNPATLARDLQYILENSDYMIEKVQAVDMFPHTHHIETVVSLVKK
jgi:23S rRNA (uracil1939-C5)-methyltransferase